MSRRKNLQKRAKARLQKAALNVVTKLTPEQQDKLAQLLAKAVATDATNNNSLRR
jgi:Spy/CpxP family protein refolding chaperone